MRRLVGVGLLLAAFALLLTPGSYAQNAGKNGKGNQVALDSSKLSAGEYVGMLKTVPGSDRLFNLEIQTVKYVPTGKPIGRLPRLNGNTGPVRNYNHSVNRIARLQNQIASAQNQMATAKTLKAAQTARNKINNLAAQLQGEVVKLQLAAVGVQAQLQAMGNAALPGFKPMVNKQLVEFQDREDVKVRTMILPEQFDDKGNVKKYTKEEKEALKGKDKTLPGYESALEQLEVGQKLRVVLVEVKKKSTARPRDKDKGPDKDADKDKDKDLDKDPDAEKKMQVKMIVILEEAVTDTKPGRKGKKGN
jgi:hypothetical protein